ncbi:MAG: lipopolysaccharide transport periplasmic protein LptA [Neomegalonema sp.]|nr:lipopolysaccharide transport periplasmic protein LptA [Neomegalonema sp.]
MGAWATRKIALAAAIVFVGLSAGAPAFAQGAETPFGGFSHDTTQPIQVSADSLEVRNADRVAVFTGTVQVQQGKIRMEADALEVRYAEGASGGQGAIDRLSAQGNVLISSGTEGAQAERAIYDVASGMIEMQGNVTLVQGEKNSLQGGRLRINLNKGTARMDGGRIGVTLTPQQGGASQTQ